MSSKYQSIEYLNCPNPHHKKQLLLSVCIDKDCTNRELICYLCQKENHPGHDTLTLVEYLDSLDECNGIEMNAGYQRALEQSLSRIKATKTKCLNSLATARQQILSMLKGVETSIVNFFSGHQNKSEEVLEGYSMKVGKNFVYSHKKKVEKVLDQFRRQLKHHSTVGNLEQMFLREGQQLLRTALVRERQLEITLDTLVFYTAETAKRDAQFTGVSEISVEEFRLNIEKELNSPTLKRKTNGEIESPNKNFAQWSRNFKHPDIELKGTEARRSLQSMKLKHVGVLREGQLEDGQLQLFEIKLKACGIIIGICLESSAKQSKMVKEASWSDIGHGHYAIANDGLTWSHSDRTVNYKVKGFRFNTGDEIQLFFKKAMGKLEFLKKGTAEKLQLDIQAPPEGDCYRLCIYLLMKGDSVLLIQRKGS